MKKKESGKWHKLFDIEVVRRALAEAGPVDPLARNRQEPNLLRRKELLTRIADKPDVYLSFAGKTHLKVLDSMAGDFPNFGQVIQAIRRNIILRYACEETLQIAPILLAGPPGTGKTEFVKTLAERLQQQYLEFSTPSITSNFVISGGHRSWSNTEPGRIAKSLIDLEGGKTLFVLLDEIDKVQDLKYPILPKLLATLEPSQARRFHDEFLELDLDIEPVTSWFATANDLRRVSEPLLSRFNVLRVDLPTLTQMPAIVHSIDRELRKSAEHMTRLFHPLDDQAINTLSVMAPRLVRRTLLAGYAIALDGAMRGRKVRVLASHLQRAARECTPLLPVPSPREDDAIMPVLMLLQRDIGGGGTPPPTLH